MSDLLNGSESKPATNPDGTPVTPVVDGTQTPAAPPWKAQLTDDLKSNTSLNQFGTISDLGKAYLDATGKLAQAVEIPQAGATAEVIESFFRKLGKPPTASEYSLKDVQDLPDLGGASPLADTADWFQETALAAKLTKGQAQTLWRAWHGRAKTELDTAISARTAAASKATAALRAELTDKFDATIEKANGIVAKHGGQEFASFLGESGLSNDPRMVKFLASIATLTGDDGIPLGHHDGALSRLRGDRIGDKANFDFPESSKHWK